MAESQRERLLAGLAQAVADNGYKATTITEIVGAASVSTRAFYEHFESKEECFLAAADAVLGHLDELARGAVAPYAAWPDRVVAALQALLDFFAAEPELARLCLVEPVTATPAIATHFRDAVLACAPYLALGREERPEGASLPDSTEDSILGGLVVLTSRAVFAGTEPLQALLPDLVEFALSPYLGPEPAQEIARRTGSA